MTIAAAALAPTALLASLAGEIEGGRQRWATPALAVCVADRRGEVAHAVFGLADADTLRAVTPRTRFAIASVTKSLAALAALMLVQQGTLQFDAPLRELLPELRLASAEAERGLTLRDLLAHRSGLPRHDAVWFGSPLDSRALFERLRHLPASQPLRGGWQYQNLLYMTLGLVIERAAGTPWQDFMRRRIFEPLGMQRANFNLDEMLADADHAEAYRIDRDGALVRHAYQRVDGIGAAGAINASIEDLSAWVSLLARGGAPLVAPEAFAQLRQAEVRVPLPPLWPELSDTHYGMGCFVTHYRGQRLVHHGGNLPGASAMTAFLPEAGLALGILSNVSRDAVRDWLAYRLLDAALGLEPIDWSSRYRRLRDETLRSEAQGLEWVSRRRAERAVASPPVATHELTGVYAHPGYGRAEVIEQQGALHLRFNGFDTALLPGDADSYETPGWEFTLGKTVARFVRNVFGDLTALELHLEAALPGVPFTRERALPEQADALAGRYTLPGQRIEVTRVGARLCWQVLGLGPRQALLPLGGLRFALEGAVDTVVEFTARGERQGVLWQTRAQALFGPRAD